MNEKIKALGTKDEIKAKDRATQDEIEKVQTYDWSRFIRQNYFFNDGSQNFLIFQSFYDTFTKDPGLTKNRRTSI